jgi:hypothetical protein
MDYVNRYLSTMAFLCREDAGGDSDLEIVWYNVVVDNYIDSGCTVLTVLFPTLGAICVCVTAKLYLHHLPCVSC